MDDLITRRFALREGGRTVGAGVVSKLLDNLTDAEKQKLVLTKAKRDQAADKDKAKA